MNLNLEQKQAVAKYLLDKSNFLWFNPHRMLEELPILRQGKTDDATLLAAVQEFAQQIPEILSKAIQDRFSSVGYELGDICGREGCTGIIKERPVENCSCHLCAPCGACASPRQYCPECGYDAREEW
jgi:hypothetical protein